MKNDLRISSDLRLPVDAMTEAIAVLATRGRGKTNLATVLAEELLKQRQQVVIVDPVGIYWGLRSSADGKSEGLRILVLGGLHGDLPLAAADAGAIAAFLVEKEASSVLDLSAFPSKAEQVRFLEVFFDRLWHLKAAHRTPMLLVLEEAQEVAPQKPREKEQIMLGRIERIAKLGRNYGIGLLMITQRPASLNKDVLNLAGILILLGIVAPIERKAAMDWISAHEVQAQADAVIASLAKLPVGDAWLWWPLRDILTRFHVRKRETFDSSATPKVGEKRVEPGRRAEVDLEAFKAELGGLIEKAKADDPRELRKRIQELEVQLKRVSLQPCIEIQEKVIEVPVLDRATIRRLQDAFERHLQQGAKVMLSTVDDVVSEVVKDLPAQPKGRTVQPAAGAGAGDRATPPTRPAVAGPTTTARSVPRAAVPVSNGKLGAGERKVLAVLAQWPDGRSQKDLAFLTGYSASASTIGVILSNLRKAGLVEPGQPVTATAAGLEAAGGVQELPSGPALLAHWYSHKKVGEGERRVLDALINAYPNALSNNELAEVTGYSPTASTLGVILSHLRKLGLVEKGARRVPDTFMESIR